MEKEEELRAGELRREEEGKLQSRCNMWEKKKKRKKYMLFITEHFSSPFKPTSNAECLHVILYVPDVFFF